MKVSGIGEHAYEALGSAGLSKEKVDELAKKKAIAIGQPMPQQLMPSYR